MSETKRIVFEFGGRNYGGLVTIDRERRELFVTVGSEGGIVQRAFDAVMKELGPFIWPDEEEPMTTKRDDR